MEALAPAELAELYFLRETVIDDQFQFWLTITFAVIVANFVAGNRLSRKTRYVVALLYTLAVVVLVSRWYYVAVEASQLRQQLGDLGIFFEFPVITMVSRVVVVVLGTASSLIFLLSNWFEDDPVA